MAIGLLGNKVGMTHIFDTNGNITPVTIISVGPCFVTQIKTHETDGYNAVQLGFAGYKDPTSLSQKSCKKPQCGHLAKFGLGPLRYSQEFKVKTPSQFQPAQKISVEIFTIGQKVQITGKSIGKGFSGNQKRHHFSRGPMTHGSKNHRAPGSIGAGTTPGRVLVGKKMAGQLGNSKTSILNLEIVKIDLEQNLLVVKGSVPGKPGNLLNIQ
jgi:large subunit ribosomal protein L3